MFSLRGILNNSYNFLRKCNFSSDSSVYRNHQRSTMEKNLILYGDEVSPPVRFVMMTASMLHIEFKFHKIDLFAGDHKTTFFKKINPLQKVPALAMDNEVICDSHAIALFLCEYSNNQDLYPGETLKKARVNEMLFFNSSELFPIDSMILSDFFAGKWPVEEKKVEKWNNLLNFLEFRLEKYQWLAGDKITLCDLCCAATISSLQILIPPSDCHKKIRQWMSRLENLPCYEINVKGLKRLSEFVAQMKTQL